MRNGVHTGTILVVDDDVAVRKLLAAALGDVGYRIVSVATGDAAVAALGQERFDVAMVDKNLGDEDGLDVIHRLRQIEPEVETIVMTAFATVDSALRAIRLGVFDYITKPFDQMEGVLHRVGRALEKRRRDLEIRSLITAMATTNRQLADMIGTLHESYLENAKVMARLCELRDPPRAGEAERVRVLATQLARECGVSSGELRWIEAAALVHDIGEAGEMDPILRKPGQLTPEEMARVRRHPLHSEALLRAVSGFDRVAQIVRHHHERYDGSGYPDALKGEDIPLGARILAVADAYVALTSPRPHRPAFEHTAALQELHDGKGRQFDDRVVTALGAAGGAGIAGRDGSV
jgi:response regulator RpfG family c-di-GMP phosphodiesterase